MVEVTFRFESGEEVKISGREGDNLLDLARAANVAIDAPCSGNGSCGKCRVRLVKGTVDSLPTTHLSDEELADGWRLACGSHVCGDVAVLVPDIASAYQSRMKTADLSSGEEIAIFDKLMADVAGAGIAFKNLFLTLPLRLEPPTLSDTMPDNERVSRAVEAALGVKTVSISFACMTRLASVLREAGFSVVVSGRRDGDTFELMDISGKEEPLCAAAVDIGTTTVSAVLADLKTGRLLAKASSGNGQIRFGADVINRIIEQGKPGGVERLQKAIIQETINPILAAMCRSAGVEPRRVLRMSVASNTTMNHLFVGVNANPVRMEPFIPSFFRWDGLRAGDLKLRAHPGAEVILAPNIGSYVGGDITAGAFASLLWNRSEFTLFIDLGTNGELVFGNREFMMACACSAGPAFEGGDISCGMRATDGAIEAVTLDCKTMEPTFRVIGESGQKPVGLCGSGIIDLIAELFRCGIISPKGRFVREGGRVRRDTHDSGRYVIAEPAESDTGREVAINEVDIESFIRAKGAIYSAIDTMMSSLEMDVSVLEHVLVAGGIGSGINMDNAVRIGMFPDIDRSKYEYIGNSSLAGAYAMAISDEAREKTDALAANMTYLELSTYPGYMDSFVAACFLPHTNAALFPSSVQEGQIHHGD